VSDQIQDAEKGALTGTFFLTDCRKVLRSLILISWPTCYLSLYLRFDRKTFPLWGCFSKARRVCKRGGFFFFRSYLLSLFWCWSPKAETWWTNHYVY